MTQMHYLVPLDCHENAAPVVAWAALMARTFHGTLTLFHVNESLELIKHHPFAQTELILGPGDNLDAWRTAYTQSVHATLTQLTSQYCHDLSVTIELREGRAPVTILEYLHEHPASLVVMGPHGRPWYQRVMIGSTAEAVLRAAPCPVLIVRNMTDATAPPRLNTLLFPSECSASGAASEAWALQLATNRDVILLHAIENPLLDIYEPDQAEIDIQHLMEESRARPPRSAQPFWEHAHQVAHAKLAAFRQQLLGVHAQVELLVQEGAAAENILHTAEQKAVDLIVMATHGRSGVRRLLLGSVAEKVIRSAPCPVLAVRSV